jgi:hypothetical protein
MLGVWSGWYSSGQEPRELNFIQCTEQSPATKNCPALNAIASLLRNTVLETITFILKLGKSL